MTTRLAAAALVGLSIAYLALFVPRGWIPHDEGMIGQSAERVMRGEVPHVDYQEPYTGGLAFMHAAVFKAAGIDLLYPRWLLFAGAVLAQCLVYLILRRYLEPIGAAFGSWLALGWSFPNYFAALPSWWLLICALVSVWALMRHSETASLWYAAVAGVAVGAAILIKQTGLYLMVALVMALLYGGAGGRQGRTWWPGRIVCGVAAAASVGFAAVILAARPSLSDLLYLFAPILACGWLLFLASPHQANRQTWQALVAPGVAVAAACVPILVFMAPYILEQEVGAFVNGAFILPRKRLQFAAMTMPPAYWILAGAPLLAAVMPVPASLHIPAKTGDTAGMLVWVMVATLLGASIYSAESYQVVWQSGRAVAALLPVAICGLLMSSVAFELRERRMLFGIAVFLAWASLVQVPFSAPVYFCYVAPLAVIAAVAVARQNAALHRPALAACAALLMAFSLVSMNRGYVYNLGAIHRPVLLDVPLELERGRLQIARADAVSYRRVVQLIADHIGDGTLVAGPDTPEVYFLTGRFSPSGTFFDFFDDNVSPEGRLNDLQGMPTATVVVLNHDQRFSQGPSARLAAKARQMFPHSEAAGTLEVRWR